jgi:hypothetical protein
MGHGDVRQKLRDAAETLATGPGDVKSRLYPALLDLATVMDDELSGELGTQYRAMWAEINGYPVGDEGTIRAAVDTITKARAVEIAKTIYFLSRAV